MPGQQTHALSSRFSSTNFQQPPADNGTSTAPNPFADHHARSVATDFAQRPPSSSTTTSPQGGSRPTTSSSRSPFSSPVTAPPRQRPIQILLINPNSTRSMTDACLASVRATLPTNVELTGYTAPYPAPTAVESATDAIMSTEACVRDLAKHAAPNGETVQNFDGMIVACYSLHPLVDALREAYDVPVIGIMEASLYVARMLGARFGIVATGQRSKFKQADYVAAYGLSHFYVGSEATNLGVLELESRDRNEVLKRVGAAAKALAGKGADTILLGCAGMTDMVRAAKDGVREEDGSRKVNVVDGVEAAVQLMAALVGMGTPTSKKGVYKGEKDGRRARGQNWL
jgi:Asp/Glu/hydantoin racemase